MAANKPAFLVRLGEGSKACPTVSIKTTTVLGLDRDCGVCRNVDLVKLRDNKTWQQLNLALTSELPSCGTCRLITEVIEYTVRPHPAQNCAVWIWPADIGDYVYKEERGWVQWFNNLIMATSNRSRLRSCNFYQLGIAIGQNNITIDLNQAGLQRLVSSRNRGSAASQTNPLSESILVQADYPSRPRGEIGFRKSCRNNSTHRLTYPTSQRSFSHMPPDAADEIRAGFAAVCANIGGILQGSDQTEDQLDLSPFQVKRNARLSGAPRDANVLRLSIIPMAQRRRGLLGLFESMFR